MHNVNIPGSTDGLNGLEISPSQLKTKLDPRGAPPDMQPDHLPVLINQVGTCQPGVYVKDLHSTVQRSLSFFHNSHSN